MFTGIISHTGSLKKKTSNSLLIDCPKDLYEKLSLGMSIAVDGICLTVAALHKPSSFEINFMPETASRTNIGYLKEKDMLNLELPVKAETLFSGHIVQGHVDCVSKILNIQEDGNSHLFTFSIDPFLSKYIVNKGSISVNGISLTVITSNPESFLVGIIPYTWEHTMLHTAQVGDYVNVEVDILAKYLEKLQRNA